VKQLNEMTYGIAGLGIMGGSIAKAIRANVFDMQGSSGKILACDISTQALDMAEEGGIIDESFSPCDAAKMLSRCDFVYVCLYPHATLEFLQEHKNDFRPGSIVTDISGVKSFLAENAQSFLTGSYDFIIGHPMAGGAKEGYVNSNGGYFAGRNYILIPQSWNKAQNLDTMKTLIGAMGFSRIVETDCRSHDHKIAFTSQLCHVIASALVESAEDDKITEFGGGSFEDLTRIAMINAPLWTELFLSNKDELLGHISEFESQLKIIKKDIADGDSEHLKEYLEDVRRKRMSMGVLVTKEK
jgi:prephenate dehydrogenase